MWEGGGLGDLMNRVLNGLLSLAKGLNAVMFHACQTHTHTPSSAHSLSPAHAPSLQLSNA